MIPKRAKHVRLEPQMIDAIWEGYKAIKDRTKSKDAACKKIASFIGCSASTVYRVICACEDAETGVVLTYDPNKYPNAMMVDHINKKFAQAVATSHVDSEDVENTSSKSDIDRLIESIQMLAFAINNPVYTFKNK